MRGPDLDLPPGFRFHPTDDELVTHYLCRKCTSQPIAVPIIAEIDLYKYDPWLLPGMALYGEKEWYFFSPRDRKYPNGSRPNRAAGSGYWKATGADKPIGSPRPVAIKKALVFYAGKAPRGEKTNWIMHEYRLADVDRSAARRKNSLRLDDWVLCRIYNKKGSADKQLTADRKTAAMRGGRQEAAAGAAAAVPEQKPAINSRVPQQQQQQQQQALGTWAPQQLMDLMYFDTSDSIPRLHADSSCSTHVVSPDFATCEREVQSRMRWQEWDRALDVAICKGGGVGAVPLLKFGGDGGELSQGCRDPLQDILWHLQKPF